MFASEATSQSTIVAIEAQKINKWHLEIHFMLIVPLFGVVFELGMWSNCHSSGLDQPRAILTPFLGNQQYFSPRSCSRKRIKISPLIYTSFLKAAWKVWFMSILQKHFALKIDSLRTQHWWRKMCATKPFLPVLSSPNNETLNRIQGDSIGLDRIVGQKHMLFAAI